MTPQDVRTLVRRSLVDGRDRTWTDVALEAFWNDVWDNGHVHLLSEYYARHYVRHAPAQPTINDLPSLKDHVLNTRELERDFRLNIEDRFFTKDRGALRWTWSATHKLTGRRWTMTGIALCRYDADGRVAEEWIQMDAAILRVHWRV
ncbi:MAG: ester cyclase [Anaerolineae bacterium]|nr:ester cyclase [Anaerolineae bacterium]